jgi:hypothetical protein
VSMGTFRSGTSRCSCWREGELECGYSRNTYPTESMNNAPSNAMWRSVGSRGEPSSTAGGLHVTDAPYVGEVQL